MEEVEDFGPVGRTGLSRDLSVAREVAVLVHSSGHEASAPARAVAVAHAFELFFLNWPHAAHEAAVEVAIWERGDARPALLFEETLEWGVQGTEAVLWIRDGHGPPATWGVEKSLYPTNHAADGKCVHAVLRSFPITRVMDAEKSIPAHIRLERLTRISSSPRLEPG